MPANFGDQELVWTLTSQGESRKAYASLRADLLVDNMVIASETGALGAGRSDPETRSNQAPVIEIEGDRMRNAQVGQPVALVARVTDDGLPISREERRARAEEEEASESPGAEQDASDDASVDTDEDAAVDAEAEEELSPELEALQRALNEPRRVTVNKTVGLHFTWFIYRGGNEATFDPIQIKPWEDSRAFMNSPWAPFWEAPPTPEDGRWVVNVTFDRPGTYVLRGRADDGGVYADEEVTINVRPLLP